MSWRASRAQARATRQSRNPPPVPQINEEPQEPPRDIINPAMSNKDKYRSTNEFMAMLQRIRVSRQGVAVNQ